MPSENISREDLLILLASMGIVLANDNKIPSEELNKRLGRALDASQEFPEIIKTTPVDPYTLPTWPSNKRLYNATRRGSLTDSFTGPMAQPKQGHSAPKEDTFKELRKSIWSIAYALDVGAKDIFLMGERNAKGIHVLFSKVFEAENETPLFFFLYKKLVTSRGSANPMDAVKRSGGMVANISELEYRMLLRLFKRNTKRLAHRYHEVFKKDGEAAFVPSFVLPIGPIGMKGIGNLAGDPGCEVCGRKITSRCVGCLSVVYCGEECRTSDWKTHKVACKTMKGGSWHPITLSNSMFADAQVDHKYCSIINRLDSLHRAKNDIETVTNETPSRIQSGKVFLAKFQTSLGAPGFKPGNMMIYDRTRSFRLFWLRSSNPQLFDEALDIIGKNMKFFWWIKQTDGFQFEICLDRAPQQDHAW